MEGEAAEVKQRGGMRVKSDALSGTPGTGG
jgi:hypothetical protein